MNTPAAENESTGADEHDVSRHQAARVLLLILALGLALNIYHALAAVIISPDSAVFISYARALTEDPLAAASEFAGRQHPLYPALIGLLHIPIGWFAGDGAAAWILSGRVVAILGSLGAILAMYWLAARLTDRRRALIAATMLAVLPDACRVGADVLSDLPHLALYLIGLAALLTGMQTGRARFVILCAFAAGLAFLTRPEGASVLVVGLAVLLSQREWKLKRRVGLAAAMIGVFAAIAAPYQLATGKLIPKKSPLELLKFGLGGEASSGSELDSALGQRDVHIDRVAHGFSRGGREPSSNSSPPPLKRWATRSTVIPTDAARRRGGIWPDCATGLDSSAHPPRADTVGMTSFPSLAVAAMPVPVNVLRQWLRAGRVVYILLAIVGVIVARPRGVGGRMLVLAIGMHVLLLHALETRYGYLDRRHALILAALSLPLAAEGVWWIANQISERAAKMRDAARTRAVIGILASCVLATGYWLLRPINAEDRYVAAAARWLSENTQPGDRIVTDDRLHRAALCANREFVRWPWWSGGVRDLDRFLADQPPCYFAVDSLHITQRNAGFFDEMEQRLGDRMELVDVEKTVGAEHPAAIQIYRYTPGGTDAGVAESN